MEKKVLYGVIIVLVIILVWGWFSLDTKISQVDQAEQNEKVLIDSVKFLNSQNAGLESSLQNCQGNDNSSELEDSIKTLNDSINGLNGGITALNEALNECQASKARPAIKVKKPVARKPSVVIRAARPSVVIRAARPANTPVVIVRDETSAADNLSELRDGNEEILACFRTNGSKDQHFPHYAIDRGASISNARGNNMRGYNYVLTPVENISGNVGVTKDGVFFISANFLKKYLNTSGETLRYVDLLYKGNWGGARMTLQNGYYILKAN